MKKSAFAKINLTLDITGVLDNGYHSLFTAMHLLGCADEITAENRTDGKIVLSANKDYIPLDEKNTCYKAAVLFRELSGIDSGCDIYIENHVPSGAGLGNSSADAAMVLKILNEINGCPLSDEVLCRQSAKVGADVPFCYAGGTRLCLNTGDEMTALPDFDYPLLVVKPVESYPTAGAYARYDASTEIVHPDNTSFLHFAEKGNYKEALRFAGNVFEQIQPEEPVKTIKKEIIESGAFFSSMSGSGSSVFGVFDKDFSVPEIEKTAEKFREQGCFAYVSPVKQ